MDVGFRFGSPLVVGSRGKNVNHIKRKMKMKRKKKCKTESFHVSERSLCGEEDCATESHGLGANHFVVYMLMLISMYVWMKGTVSQGGVT